LLELMAAILTTSVAMEYQPRRRQSAQVRHFQGILHQAGLHVGLDAPSYDLSTEQVEHGRQIQPTLLCRQWSKRPGVVELSPGLSSPNRTCTSQRIRLSIQALLIAKATSG